jgi:probable HAF family extracellular repeat protein
MDVDTFAVQPANRCCNPAYTVNPMNPKNTLLTAALGLIISAMTAQAAALAPPSYTVTTIPLLPGYNVMRPTALNNAGEVVGVASNTTGSPAAHTFLYKGGKVHDLGALGTPIAINVFGAILTSSSLYQGGRLVATAPVGSSFSGLNDIGQIIGSGNVKVGYDNSMQATVGFLRQLNGTIVSLTFQGSAALPVAINDVGQIVADYEVPNPFTGYNPVTGVGYASQTGPMRRVVLLQPGGKNGVDIGTLGFWTFAAGLNNFGQVVANSQILDNDTSEFVYEAPVDAIVYSGGTLTNLGTDPFGGGTPVDYGSGFQSGYGSNGIDYGGDYGMSAAIPAAVNDFGTIVGTFIALLGEDVGTATLYTGGQWYNLNEITTGLPPLPWWTPYPGYPNYYEFLTDCVAINDRGVIIAAQISNTGGSDSYYLLAPLKATGSMLK